jgi:hypothetical protein
MVLFRCRRAQLWQLVLLPRGVPGGYIAARQKDYGGVLVISLPFRDRTDAADQLALALAKFGGTRSGLRRAKSGF